MDQITDTSEISLEDQIRATNAKIDMLGQQMNWLCENMQSLFQFIQAVGSSGGGIRGLMSAMKNAPKEVQMEETNGGD